MATNLTNLVRRAETSGLSQTMINLLVALMVLLIVAVLLVGVLIILRQRRKSIKALKVPPSNNTRLSTSSMHSLHRRVSARPTSQSVHVFREKQLFEESSDAPPPSGGRLPEIRITFPEEVDSAGKRQSGQVVVVHVGNSSTVGLEPVSEQLPPYHQRAGDRFELIDLESVGGLTEKETRPALGWR